MIFLAFNYFKYKIHTDENLKYKEFILNKINQYFPNEDYLLPYSQYSRLELIKKLKCNNNDISGIFLKDLKYIISKCDKLIFFPSESLFIGSAMYLEISAAIKKNLPIYCYNQSTGEFTKNFIIKNSEFAEDFVLRSIFYKKIDIL